MSDQAYREQLLQRTFGMSPDANVSMMVELAKKDDWWRKCKHCGKVITGTMEHVRKRCDCHD